MANLVWRTLVALFGICAIAWAISVIPIYHTGAPLAETSERILSGDKFNATQLGVIKSQLDAAPPRPFKASASSGAVVIRLLLLEDQLKVPGRSPSAADLDELEKIVGATLAQSPASSFIWLTDFSLKRLRGEPTDNDLNLLRMSYWSGPNEGWIAIRRNRLALGNFPRLPSELAEKAVSEFVGLVRSGLYADASNILLGPGWPIREKLLNRIAQIDQVDRREFAKMLASKNADVVVPGEDLRPSRPF
jgi:hypothetical protein